MRRFGGYDDRPVFAELYDFVPFYVQRPDVDFYVDLAHQAGGSILELGCGTGRILIPTAAAGYSIVGLDLSEHMLARCRGKIQDLPQAMQERICLVQQNMTSFNLDRTFVLVTTPFRSFQHLVSVDDQLSCLHQVNRHLETGGRLVLDLFQVKFKYLTDPALAEEKEDFSDIDLPDGRKLRRAHRIVRIHPARQYNDVEMIYYLTHPEGRTERLVQAFPFRYFFRYEVEHLLARCGFAVTDVFGGFDRSPFQDDSPEMIFVAKKNKDL